MNDTEPTQRNWLLRFFSNHPTLGVLGALGSIASIIALPYTIWPQVPKRELTYCIQPIRTTLVEVNQKSDIAVTYKGTPISGDLTAAQIMIGNAGSEPIRREDIVTPIVLSVSNASIIETSLSTPPLRGTEFRVDTSLASGHLGMDWKILEKGDNPVIQIVYSGKRDLPIVLTGRIVGQAYPKEILWPTTGKGSFWARLGWGVCGLCFSCIMFTGMIVFITEGAQSRRSNIIVGFVTTLLIFCFFYYVLSWFRMP